MKVKLTKQYKQWPAGTELETTNDLAEFLKQNGYLTAKKNTKKAKEVKEI